MTTKLILHGVIKWKSDSESNHSRLITKIKLNTHKLKEGRLHSCTHCSHILHIVYVRHYSTHPECEDWGKL